jgi:glycosyltransferase involved in cell wall biosynthesis
MHQAARNSIDAEHSPALEVTVCICTRDRADDLRQCLQALDAQDASPARYEILVVDNGSSEACRAANAALCAGRRRVRLFARGICTLSEARNEAAAAARGRFLAYLDDDALPAPDWISRILDAIADPSAPPAVLGGRILPVWEAPLPGWWPERLRGVLSLIPEETGGEYRTPALPPGSEPYGANMIVERAALLDAGGFSPRLGRRGGLLLSNEEVHLAWRLQDAGRSVRYDPRILVRHRIPAQRLTVRWLLARLYWQGVSNALTDRMLAGPHRVLRNMPRRALVAALFAPAWLAPRGSAWLIGLRWRLAYSLGYLRGALGPRV